MEQTNSRVLHAFNNKRNKETILAKTTSKAKVPCELTLQFDG